MDLVKQIAFAIAVAVFQRGVVGYDRTFDRNDIPGLPAGTEITVKVVISRRSVHVANYESITSAPAYSDTY